MKLVTTEQMRRIEEEAFSYGVSKNYMMRQVAFAVANRAQEILSEQNYTKTVVLCGSGKNGQDALLTASELHQRGTRVHVFAVSAWPQTTDMPQLAFSLTYIKNRTDIDKLSDTITNGTLVIDGLFGTGLTRLVDGLISQVISVINAASSNNENVKVISIDVPSGLNADSGLIMGSCVVACETLACGLGKIGLFQNSGSSHTGSVSFCDIGLPSKTYEAIKAELIDKDLAKRLLPSRSQFTCKNGFGKVLIVGGSASYVGAPVLAALGAAKSGVGITTLAQPKSIYLSSAPAVLFATHLPCEDFEGNFSAASATKLSDHFNDYDAMAIGCGVSPDVQAFNFMWQCLIAAQKAGLKTVADAGALHMLSQKEGFFNELSDDLVLTPHAGEMSRLSGLTVDYINQNKIAVALEYAQKWHKIILLKGPNTVIAAPNGEFYVASFANSILAVGGSGDVLSGCIAALMAQGLGALDACALAVYLQGASANICAKRFGRRGVTPDQIAASICEAIAELEV